MPELTRNEYLRLLQTAKAPEANARPICWCCCSARWICRFAALSRVTVEAVREGWVFAPRRLRVPPCLRAELLAYAGERGIGSGPVFCTRYGKLMDRGNINVRIQSLVPRRAGIAGKMQSPVPAETVYCHAGEHPGQSGAAGRADL